MWIMFVKPMKEKLYNYLVNENQTVFQKYRDYCRENYGAPKIKRWVYLMKLFLQYSVFNKQNQQKTTSYYGTYEEQRESEVAKRKSPEELVEILESYDIVSFDIFDTLLFRPLCQPSDLFFFVGEKLNYLNFIQIRIEMEQRARAIKEQTLGTREVTLEEIWQQVEEETGINKEIGIHTELEVELAMCFVNPYMEKVLGELQKRGKRIIGISDMYLSQNQIKDLLSTAGMPNVLEKIFVSSEHGASKSNGGLYEIVKKQIGEEKTYIHLGDNEHSDVRQARKQGFKTYYYPNVNDIGAKYRPKEMSSIIGSVYRGLVNTYIHSGIKIYSKPYELGFIYGGLFVLGYCKWINGIVDKEKIDKILFLSRDGDIIEKVYSRLFKGDKEYMQPNRLEFVYSNDGMIAKEVQQGILDFVDYYIERIKDASEISGRDAYAPIWALGNHVDIVEKVVGRDFFKMNVGYANKH